MNNVPKLSDEPAAVVDEHSVRRYRCVCGVSFEIEPAEGRVCPSCGRHYDPRVFSPKFADTMTFAGDLAGKPATMMVSTGDSLIGTTLGHYRIVGLLGEGGMGAVYQAVDESLQRYVALKVIRPQPRAGSSMFNQLVQEARAQARVNHPNVVHIYFVSQAEESPFFAMELIPGPTLANRLAAGPVPFSDVVRIGWQVASALERAAQFDIVHGDVKPSNILEVDNQTVKISDFGLSRLLSSTNGESERIAGTPNYLAPECVRGESPDARSDIYSLGVTLYELTFGKLPFQLSGATLRERLDAHLTQSPSFPESWPENIPEGWHDVLLRMLAKNPAERYENYADLRSDLTRLMPKRLIPAARPSRIIAWGLDALLLTGMQGLVMAPTLFFNTFFAEQYALLWRWLAAIVGTALSGMVLMFAIWMQCRWSATPGKMFFQLAIVDSHGLRPSRRKLSLRVLFQFPWIGLFFTPMLPVLGLSFLDNLLAAAAALATVVSIGYFLFRRDQKALHDTLLRTRVVVQADDVD